MKKALKNKDNPTDFEFIENSQNRYSRTRIKIWFHHSTEKWEQNN